MTTPIREAMRSAKHSACHLELRDSYGVAEEDAELRAWMDGTSRATEAERARRKGWLDTVAEAVGRGVEVRRLRIVSEPVSRYIRFEHAGTELIVEAGEQVRWLPRRSAVGLVLPPVDFWLFDDQTVIFNHFTGDGKWDGMETRAEPEIAETCSRGFASAWERAIPHADFRIA